MSKGYVVLERGFEYNDEYYNEHEDGGGNPTNFFFSLEMAKNKVKELDLQRCKSYSVEEYASSLRERDNKNLAEFCQSLVEKYGEHPKPKYGWDNTKYKLHHLSSPEEGEIYLSLLKFSFFEIVPVDLDPSDMRENSIEKILN